jgi:hypothetical protein
MCSFVCLRLQECLEAAQKLNSLWRGKNYAPLLQQPFSADAISALPKGIKLLQRSADSMQKLAATVETCRPDSSSSSATNVVAQQSFLQDLQQHNPAQLAAELLSWLQAWPDLSDALLYAEQPDASNRVQVAAGLLWQGASRTLRFLLEVVQQRAAANRGLLHAPLDLLEQLVGPCCTTGTPGLLEFDGVMNASCASAGRSMCTGNAAACIKYHHHHHQTTECTHSMLL